MDTHWSDYTALSVALGFAVATSVAFVWMLAEGIGIILHYRNERKLNGTESSRHSRVDPTVYRGLHLVNNVNWIPGVNRDARLLQDKATRDRIVRDISSEDSGGGEGV